MRDLSNYYVVRIWEAVAKHNVTEVMVPEKASLILRVSLYVTGIYYLVTISDLLNSVFQTDIVNLSVYKATAFKEITKRIKVNEDLILSFRHTTRLTHSVSFVILKLYFCLRKFLFFCLLIRYFFPPLFYLISYYFFLFFSSLSGHFFLQLSLHLCLVFEVIFDPSTLMSSSNDTGINDAAEAG